MTLQTHPGAVCLWRRGTLVGQLDAAAATFESGAAAATVARSVREQPDCLGNLALLEAIRGRLSRAAELAAAATRHR